MNSLEQHLLQTETGGTEPRICLRSGTLVDTGRWWRRSPVWLCATDSDLLMLAVARRRFLTRVPLRSIGASRYHHASGELVIEPGEELPLHRFKLSLPDALRILHHIQIASDSQQPHTTSC